MRDLIKKLPKLRGHGVNRAQTVNAERVRPAVINVADLQSFEGTEVSPKTLVAAGLVAARRKQAPEVKILGTGELTKKLTVTGCQVSAAAKTKIENAGGTVA
jgi:large subunit ribosomal protein L15